MASSLDEDKLEKAVAFLLHPSVRGSDDEAKRSFLQNKGLSSEEIAEAFRRTADGTSASADRDGGTGMHLNTAPIPSSSTATMDSSRVGQMQNIAPPRSGVSYTNILVGIGFAAAAAYSIKTIFGPSISRTIDAVKSSLQGAHDNTSSQNGLTIVEVETDDDGSYTTNNTNNTNIENKNSGKNDRELVEAIRDQTEQLRQSMELLIRSSNAGHDSISELREEVKILNDRLQHGVVPGMTGVTGSKSVGQNGLHHHAHMNDTNDESTPMSYMQVLVRIKTRVGARAHLDNLTRALRLFVTWLARKCSSRDDPSPAFGTTSMTNPPIRTCLRLHPRCSVERNRGRRMRGRSTFTTHSMTSPSTMPPGRRAQLPADETSPAPGPPTRYMRALQRLPTSTRPSSQRRKRQRAGLPLHLSLGVPRPCPWPPWTPTDVYEALDFLCDRIPQ